MRIRNILLMLRGYEQGATRKSVSQAVGVSEGVVGRYYRAFKAEGFTKAFETSGWTYSRPDFYPGPDIIGKPIDAKEDTTKGACAIKGTSFKGQAKGRLRPLGGSD